MGWVWWDEHVYAEVISTDKVIYDIILDHIRSQYKLCINLLQIEMKSLCSVAQDKHVFLLHTGLQYIG